MNLFDFIVTGCFGGAPAMPPMPAAPPPLPDPSIAAEEKAVKARADEAAKRKRGRASLITNEGGAAGLEEDSTTSKQKLGGY
tara:strand:+ start:936 stop:1181 length:246 start_codon:yes stop_codon:yes gene_type:complete